MSHGDPDSASFCWPAHDNWNVRLQRSCLNVVLEAACYPQHLLLHLLAATYYGTDDRIEASRVACGEPAGQFGIVAQGSCGYTNSDGSLPFPREMYAAAADTNEDYPGSCGRCYQVRVCMPCDWLA